MVKIEKEVWEEEEEGREEGGGVANKKWWRFFFGAGPGLLGILAIIHST